MELQRIEVQSPRDGSKQTWNSGVKIKKCRYLEAPACAGGRAWVADHACMGLPPAVACQASEQRC